jgi:hypothetical protein
VNSDFSSVVLPQFFPQHWLVGAPDIVHTEFPSRIRIGYVIRGEGAYSYLMREEFAASGLDLVQLHEFALRNLGALTMPNFQVARTPGGAEAYLADDVDRFTAVRILLPVVRRALVAELGDEHFAAIPCRDWFICWSKDQHHEFQAKNLRDARDIFLKDDYNLTPDVFAVSESGFKLHSEQAVDG